MISPLPYHISSPACRLPPLFHLFLYLKLSSHLHPHLKLHRHPIFCIKQRRHEVDYSACFIGYNHDRFSAVLIGNGGMFNTWRRLTSVKLKLYPPWCSWTVLFGLHFEWTQMAIYLQYSVFKYICLCSHNIWSMFNFVVPQQYRTIYSIFRL